MCQGRSVGAWRGSRRQKSASSGGKWSARAIEMRSGLVLDNADPLNTGVSQMRFGVRMLGEKPLHHLGRSTCIHAHQRVDQCLPTKMGEGTATVTMGSARRSHRASGGVGERGRIETWVVLAQYVR